MKSYPGETSSLHAFPVHLFLATVERDPAETASLIRASMEGLLAVYLQLQGEINDCWIVM